MKNSAKQKGKLYVVANAHLDTQWNWTVQDTIRDCVKNTLERNFELFKKYPAYRMNFEGAFRYKLAKEYYPDLYEELKGYISEGRWNVSGSTWDAMDANVPSSEALMRQVLLGNGYFEREFGKKSSDIFLADCFGFRYALPSVAAHMGLNGFHTQKLVWGAGSPIIQTDGKVSAPLPGGSNVRMDLGRWVGPDGNGVFVSLLEGNYTYNFDNHGETTPINRRERYLDDIEHNEKYAGVAKRSMYFGTGDYGGSCKEESARMVQEAVDDNGNPDALFEVVSASTDQIFNELTEEEKAALPTYDGMLLIPHGYGAMTSHTVNKRWNRKAELLADATERLCRMATERCGREYPYEKIRDAWELILWHQFHDDLPGTSIAAAYEFTYNDYILAFNLLSSELAGAMQALGTTLDTSNGEGSSLILYNPTSLERRDSVTVPMEGQFIAIGPDGETIPTQCVGKQLTFLPTLAPLSLSVIRLLPAAEAMPAAVIATEKTLENEYLKLTLDENGDICSIFDKENGKEILSAPIRFTVTEDNNVVWPSWEIRYEDLFLEPRFVTGVGHIEAVSGAAEGRIVIERSFGDSSFLQTISIASGSRRVDVDNRVDWFERRSLLRAVFPLTVSNEKATFDQGLGAIESGNTTSHPYFQANVHQWADLTDASGAYGVGILNDCKYGMEKPADNTLSLTLIHTPLGDFCAESGQNYQDMGRNEFRFSICPHKGSRDAVADEALRVNQPVIPFVTSKHEGNGRSFTMATVEGTGVQLRCFKREEKGERLIVRVQETTGRAQTGSIRFAYPIDSAVETNGYEDFLGDADFADNTLRFSLGKYGVKTFAVTLRGEKTDGARYTPVVLPFDTRTTTCHDDLTAGALKDGISIPCSLWSETETCGGVPFTMGKCDANNALVCAGQQICLPDGCTKAHLVLTSLNGDKPLCGDVFDRIGSWDQIPLGNTCRIKRAPIVRYYSHTHGAEGDRPYCFAYLFHAAADAPNGLLTLPNDKDLLLFAVTAEADTPSAVCPATPLYDVAEEDTGKKYSLTTVGCTAGKGENRYAAGHPVLIHANFMGDKGLFKGFESDASLASVEGTVALIRMPAKDVTVKAVYEEIGEDILLGRPCRESGSTGSREAGCKALTADCDEKWCAPMGDGNCCFLEVTLDHLTRIGSYAVLHCGAFEGGQWNTKDFAIQYRTGDGEWLVADQVYGNKEDLTHRHFTPVEATEVRLMITKPSQTDDDHCRIYRFMVFEA